jgi:hypothetical protein
MAIENKRLASQDKQSTNETDELPFESKSRLAVIRYDIKLVRNKRNAELLALTKSAERVRLRYGQELERLKGEEKRIRAGELVDPEPEVVRRKRKRKKIAKAANLPAADIPATPAAVTPVVAPAAAQPAPPAQAERRVKLTADDATQHLLRNNLGFAVTPAA